MPVGVLFALLSYASFSFADATIKSFGDSLSVFEIGFFCTLFSFVPALLVKPKGERWRDAWRMTHPWLMQLRALCGLVSTMLVIFAFTTIPLAEAYALIFLSPILVVMLSVFVLKEQMTPMRWGLLAVSFMGVLMVVQPGFRELQPGHFAAALGACAAAVGAIVLKIISVKERRTSLLATLLGYGLVFNGIAMIPSFVMPTLEQFGLMLMIGTFAGIGHLTMIAATRSAPANHIAPMQYSQIFWAILLGGLFYSEVPDALGLVGLAIVVVAGILNATSEVAQAKLRLLLARMQARRRTIQGPLPEPELPEQVELEINQPPTRPII